MIYSIQRYCIHDGRGIRTTVFFKGCQLRCPWCANPESQESGTEIGFFAQKCLNCGKCTEICPQKAIHNGKIDRERCTVCGQCISYCPGEALQQFGMELSVPELLSEIEKDMRFYRRSGGGVTLSGGEAVLQKTFVMELLKELKARQIHIALESNACYEPVLGQELLPLIDQYLLDLKHMDPEKHRSLLGISNDRVLRNLKTASEKDLTIRIPLIRGFNDDNENLKKSALFAKDLNVPIELLGFHNYAAAKYAALGKIYAYQDERPYDKVILEEKKKYIRNFGVQVVE